MPKVKENKKYDQEWFYRNADIIENWHDHIENLHNVSVEFLKEFSSDINLDNLLRHCTMSSKNFSFLIRNLVNTGIRINQISPVDGFTPLIRAAKLQNIVHVELLLELGSDPYCEDTNGCTALDHINMYYKKQKTIKIRNMLERSMKEYEEE